MLRLSMLPFPLSSAPILGSGLDTRSSENDGDRVTIYNTTAWRSLL
jgi:hypothetical protein